MLLPLQIGPAEPTTGLLMWSDDIVQHFTTMDCTQLLTVRFSKPLPGCPIMFMDILNAKSLGSSKDESVSTENALTERMIRDGQAVHMPDNKHVAKWYSEVYAKCTQPVNAGEKMVASLTHRDIHYAHMPILDVGLFQAVDSHSAQTRKSFSNNDRSQHQLNQCQLSSANCGQAQPNKLKEASPQTLDKSRPLQQSVNDRQSLKKVDGGQPPMNKSRALLQSDIDVNQSVLNVCPVFELKGSNSETQQSYAVSSDFNNDYQKNNYGAAGGVSAPSDLPKVLCQSRMEAVNSSSADFGQRKVSGQDQTTSSGTFMTAEQSGVDSSYLHGKCLSNYNLSNYNLF